MATVSAHAPAQFHVPDPLVHIARPPFERSYCGRPRDTDLKPDASPTCVVCLAMYEARRGHPWGSA
jgi:hypothetical protein